MLQKQKEPIEEGEVPLTEQQICEQVLGKEYGYIRGRGHGPKPNRRAYSSASSSTRHVVEELASTKEIVATQQTQIEAQQSQLEAQQKKIDWLQSVVSNLVGISPPMDGTSATGLGFLTDRSVLRQATYLFLLMVLWSQMEGQGGEATLERCRGHVGSDRSSAKLDAKRVVPDLQIRLTNTRCQILE